MFFFYSLLVLMGLCGVAQAEHVTLAWDDNTEDNVVGYRLYYGNRSRRYPWYEELRRSDSCRAGSCSTALDLPEGHWYFSVTAFDASNRESAFSEEVDAVLGSGAGFERKPMPWLILLLGD